MSRPVSCWLLAVLLVFAPVADATWSIVLVDTATGEVAVGSATCLTGLDLRRLLPVVVVEKGGAAAQSSIDIGAVNRKKIWDELLVGTPAPQIIEIAKQGDFFKASRQYGVVEASPTAAGFTGNAAFGYKEDRQGAVGTVAYSIQGNVLAGVEVMDAMEASLLGSSGPLAQRLMDAMVAAQLSGGDGRCWCSVNEPQSCDPADFDPAVDKSADIGFMVVARPGDSLGVCNASLGCANGDYYMTLDVANQASESADPVIQLTALYDDFVQDQVGRPDGITSSAAFDDGEVVASSGDLRTLTVTVRDIDGTPLDAAAFDVGVTHAEASAGLSTIESVTTSPDGEIVVELRGGDGVGTDVFDVRVDDGVVSALIAPRPELEHVASLAGGGDVSASAGGVVPFELRGPDGLAGVTVVLGLSASGTEPGTPVGSGVVLPLNVDRLYLASASLAETGYITGSPGTLDADSRASAALRVPAGVFIDLVGLELAAAWVTSGVGDVFASNAVVFEVR